MAVDQEARDLINAILAEFATRWDGGAWGIPADFSVLVRQDQPPDSGTSQFKGEDVPMAVQTLLLREAGDIAGKKISALTDLPAPGAADVLLAESAGGLLRKVDVSNLPGGGGGGETNTASNVGTAGTGVFKQKTGVDLELYKLNAASAKLTVALDGVDKIDLDLGSVASTDLSDAATIDADTVDGEHASAFADAGHTHVEADITDLLHYTHPNHTGDVTSTGDGATVIGANKVLNTMLADMAANTIKANVTGSTADPADLAVAASRIVGRKATGNIVALTGAEALAIVGTIPLTGGGTGQTTQQAALDALMPATPAEGDTLYYDGTNWVKHATRFSALIAIADPASSDEFGYISFENDVTILEVKSYVVVGSSTPTVNFNLIDRAKPGDSGGTNITSSTMQATAAGTTTTTFSHEDVNAGNMLTFDATATGGSVQLIRIFVKYRYR